MERRTAYEFPDNGTDWNLRWRDCREIIQKRKKHAGL